MIIIFAIVPIILFIFLLYLIVSPVKTGNKVFRNAKRFRVGFGPFDVEVDNNKYNSKVNVQRETSDLEKASMVVDSIYKGKKMRYYSKYGSYDNYKKSKHDDNVVDRIGETKSKEKNKFKDIYEEDRYMVEHLHPKDYNKWLDSLPSKKRNLIDEKNKKDWDEIFRMTEGL